MLRKFITLVMCVSIAPTFPPVALAAESLHSTPMTAPVRHSTAAYGQRPNASVSNEKPRPVCITANLGVGQMLGHTLYRIRFSSFSEMAGSEVLGESKLDFPLEVLLAELDLSLQSTSEVRRSWAIAMGLRKSIYDHVGKMEDSDWVSIPEFGYHEKLYFTQSDAEADAIILDLKGHLELLSGSNWTVKGMLGYMYQSFSYELFGASGWKLDSEDQRVYFNLFEGVNVLDYDISYSLPYFGVAASLGRPPRPTLDAQLAFSPLAFANDRDDHILRNKLIEGDCRGTFFAAGVTASWTVALRETGPMWLFQLGAECLRTDTDGDQAQFFYGDDPSFEGDETGLRVEGIDLEISSRQYRMILQFGLRF